ncbi:MAG TPA: helix-turn-helix domain-containing protein [Candidatus Hydrogenedentes bacterium]|nr:helix-turn-helix domain-containing protein [Candidatus Hydrogenedentota bacterium]HIJ74663.1 helix-turn-helix domain-containing protein [Candidatus Hydrogenedentota bacterium]
MIAQPQMPAWTDVQNRRQGIPSQRRQARRLPKGRRDGNSETYAVGLPLVSQKALDAFSAEHGALYELFAATTHLEVLLFAPDPITQEYRLKGLVETAPLPQYCELVRSTAQGAARCASSHREMMHRTLRPPQNACQRCHAGLLTIHFPISIDGKRSADLHAVYGLDQEYPRDTLPRLYERVADLGLAEKAVVEAAQSLPTSSRPSPALVSKWLRLFANYLAKSSAALDEARRDHETPVLAKPALADTAICRAIRRHVERRVMLPPVRNNGISSGCSAALIDSVVVFLDRQYHLPLSTRLVAYSLGFAPTYFGKAFKRYAKMSMADHVRRVRLAHAKTLLANPYLRVAEVARQTGFADASYFTRAFRKAFGMTPLQFRKLARQ